MRDRKITPTEPRRERDGKRAPRGAKSKQATTARKQARQRKHAQQGRA